MLKVYHYRSQSLGWLLLLLPLFLLIGLPFFLVVGSVLTALFYWKGRQWKRLVRESQRRAENLEREGAASVETFRSDDRQDPSVIEISDYKKLN